MNEQTWIDPRTDRSEWGSGEWDGEPDKVQWTDEGTGLVCLAKRNPHSGNWCGYVGVSAAHPWHSKGYSDDALEDVRVHGGLTFSDSCQEGPPEQTICHIPDPGEPDGLWWFGFDCHHAWDYAPYNAKMAKDHPCFARTSDEIYRTLGYVKSECRGLAQQIANAALPT